MDVGDLASLSGFTATDIVGALNELKGDVAAISLNAVYFTMSTGSVPGNADRTLTITMPTGYVFTDFKAIIPIGFTVGSNWDTTVVIKGVDLGENEWTVSVRTTGLTTQTYTIRFVGLVG